MSNGPFQRLRGWLYGAKYAQVRRLVAANFRLYRRSYLLALAAMAVQAAATAASAYIMKHVINDVFLGKSLTVAFLIAGITVAIFVMKGVGDYFSSILLNRIGNNMIARMQSDMFRAIVRQDMPFFDQIPLGELITRIANNAQAARRLMNLVVISLGRDIVTLIGLTTLMVAQNPLMSLSALAIAPPAVFGIRYLMRRIKVMARREVVSTGRMVTIVQETVQGNRVMRAYGLEPRLRGLMAVAIREIEQLSNRKALLSARTRPLMEGLGGVAIAFAVLYGGYSVVVFGESPGAFFSFLAALLLAYEPAKRLAKLNVDLEMQITGVRMMYEILDARPAIVDAADAAPFAADSVALGFDDVAFAYRDGQPVLDGVSFTAATGTVTALVGPSGAGKSTLFALIERFYDVNSGRITLDGHDIRDIRLADLRAHIALVTQDTFLFEGSIASNIADGRPSASRAEIEAAARDANAYAFIMALPRGFDTPVTAGGSSLSGGQRQRISIARAILRRAPILLLDEATSALDAQSEAEVQDALARLMVGRTTLVIAHRLATVRDADRICVLDKGRVVQAGSHDDLLAEGGLYAHLHALQFRDKQRHGSA